MMAAGLVGGPRIEEIWKHAYDSSVGTQGPCPCCREDEEPGIAVVAAEARCVRSRVHPDAEEAELRVAQGGPRAPHQWHRGDDLHPGRRPQPAGALDRAHPRRPREGPPGRALPRDPRHPGCGRRAEPPPGAVEVRCEAAEGLMPG